MVFQNIGEIAYDIIANDQTSAGLTSAEGGIDSLDSAFANLDTTIQANIGTIFAFSTAVAVAGTALANISDKNAAFEKSIEKSIYRMGIQIDDNLEWARSMTHADDSIMDTVSTIDYLSRNQIKNKDTVEDLIALYDLLGDAEGKSTTQIAQMVIPTLQAFDIALEDSADHVGAFAMVMEKTTMGDWFPYLASRFAPYLKELGISLEDFAGIFVTMAEHGITNSRVAIRMFMEATKAAEENGKAVTKATKDQTEAEKDLKDVRDKISQSNEDYYLDVLAAGSDVAEIRRITIAHNRELEKEKRKEKELQTKYDTATKDLDIAKAKTFTREDTLKSIVETTGGKFTVQEIEERIGAAKDYKSAITDLAEIDVKTLGAGQKRANWIEQETIAVGKLTTGYEDLIGAMQNVGTASAVISGAAGLATIFNIFGRSGGGGFRAPPGGLGSLPGFGGGINPAGTIPGGAGRVTTSAGQVLRSGGLTEAEQIALGWGGSGALTAEQIALGRGGINPAGRLAGGAVRTGVGAGGVTAAEEMALGWGTETVAAETGVAGAGGVGLSALAVPAAALVLTILGEVVLMDWYTKHVAAEQERIRAEFKAEHGFEKPTQVTEAGTFVNPKWEEEAKAAGASKKEIETIKFQANPEAWMQDYIEKNYPITPAVAAAGEEKPTLEQQLEVPGGLTEEQIVEAQMKAPPEPSWLEKMLYIKEPTLPGFEEETPKIPETPTTPPTAETAIPPVATETIETNTVETVTEKEVTREVLPGEVNIPTVTTMTVDNMHIKTLVGGGLPATGGVGAVETPQPPKPPLPASVVTPQGVTPGLSYVDEGGIVRITGETAPTSPGKASAGMEIPFVAPLPEVTAIPTVPTPEPSALEANLEAAGYPTMATGGIVPGEEGEPQAIVAHGGEVVVPVGKKRQPTPFEGFGDYSMGAEDTDFFDKISKVIGNAAESFIQTLEKGALASQKSPIASMFTQIPQPEPESQKNALGEPSNAPPPVNVTNNIDKRVNLTIQNVNLSKDYPVQDFYKDVTTKLDLEAGAQGVNYSGI